MHPVPRAGAFQYCTSVNPTLIASLIPSIVCHYSEFRGVENKSAIFGSQKPHRADNMLHNTRSTAQISQQLLIQLDSLADAQQTEREKDKNKPRDG